MDTMTDTVCENTSTAGLAVMGSATLGLPRVAPVVGRKRLKELFALAYETVEWLEKKGLKRGEQCEFREIAERIWFKD